MMKILVITGGIGSGKSEVCGILREMGLTAQYNADQRVKHLYSEHPGLLDDMESVLGTGLRDEEGRFLPGKLAEIIFSDSLALEKVESLVFPALMKDFSSFSDMHSDEKIIIFESATILEKPYFDGFGDRILLVDAPYPLRLERACRRDGAKRGDIIARMENQKLMNSLSAGQTDSRIDAVIMNDSGLDELKEKTYETILHLFDN